MGLSDVFFKHRRIDYTFIQAVVSKIKKIVAVIIIKMLFFNEGICPCEAVRHTHFVVSCDSLLGMLRIILSEYHPAPVPDHRRAAEEGTYTGPVPYKMRELSDSVHYSRTDTYIVCSFTYVKFYHLHFLPFIISRKHTFTVITCLYFFFCRSRKAVLSFHF